MRDDQYGKLQDLATKIADVVIHDADPDNWIAVNVPAKDLSREERGDAYWCRRLATSSLSVLMKVTSVLGQIKHQEKNGLNPVESDDEADDLDQEIKDAEREAGRLLKQLTSREALKAKFDKSVAGKG